MIVTLTFESGGMGDRPTSGCAILLSVFVALMLALLCVPLLELVVIVQVSGFVGVWETIGLMVLVSVVGAWMVRRSGFGVIQQAKYRLAQGEMPTSELFDGSLILVAGAFMLTPGFFTDAIGLLILFQPTRALVRSMLVHQLKARMKIFNWTDPGSGAGFSNVFEAREAGDRAGRESRNHSSNDGAD